MVENTEANGEMENNMGRASILQLLVQKERVYGKMGNELSG
jgi:hypothetical protein